MMLRVEVDGIIAEIPKDVPVQIANAVNHLNEAADSITNNIAEGNDSIYPNKKTTYFDIAATSTREAKSSLESLVRRKAITEKRAYRAIGFAIVIGKMLAELLPPQ